jgi:plastocyanin
LFSRDNSILTKEVGMPVLRMIRPIVVLILVVFAAFPAQFAAQDATPVPESPPDGGVIVASGLTSPRGITFGLDGQIFVSLAGSGGTNEATETAPTTDAIGPWLGGPTAAVALIDDQGCPVPLITSLPSSIDSTGGILGADDVAILGDQLYVAVDGGGPVHGNPDMPSGVYQLLADEEPLLIADLSAWTRANPPEALPGDYDPDAAGYGMVADESTGILWVVDPNVGQILGVTPFGEIFRIADLSAEHPVPTKPVLDPNGGIYVGTLSTVPFTDGVSRVMHIDIDGNVTDVWTNLTTVVDVAVGQDGTLYALEMSTGNLEEPPFLQPASGRILQQTGPDSSEAVVDELMFPIALEAGPDGGLYVSMPALGAGDGSGVIVKYGGEETEAASTDCAPIEETLSQVEPEVPASTPQPEIPATAAVIEAPETEEPATEEPVTEEPVTEEPVTEEPATEEPATEEPATEEAATEEAPLLIEASPVASPVASPQAVGPNDVSIEAFAFVQNELVVPVGSTVTFVNNDTVAHTATASDGTFSTGNIAPGESVPVTLDQPGTYLYSCSYHPNMKGVVIVVG